MSFKTRLLIGFRRFQIDMLKRADPEKLETLAAKKLLRRFRRSARQIPHYRELLAAGHCRPGEVRTIADFQRICPPQDKSTTFQDRTLNDLVARHRLPLLSAVVTSSGLAGPFGFGATDSAGARQASRAVDLGLAYHFDADRCSTLLINCLPMGVHIGCSNATVAEVSVREDMALAIAGYFGPHYDQVVFVGDPLFLKRLADTAGAQNIDWRQMRIHIIVGGDGFGENFRNYLAGCFAIDLSRPEAGSIRSSLGVAELGLNLLFELPETIELRRRAGNDENLARKLYGRVCPGVPPTLFVYNPLRSFIEVCDPDEFGFGAMTLSMAESAALPMYRYQTGDLVRPVSRASLRQIRLADGRTAADAIRLPVLAFLGRGSDCLGPDSHMLDFKDALYRNAETARSLSGALRLRREPERWTIDIQLAPGYEVDPTYRHRLRAWLPAGGLCSKINLYRYEDYPHGLSFDYERKFRFLEQGSEPTPKTRRTGTGAP